MGQTLIPRPPLDSSRPVFVQPRELPLAIWTRAVEEVSRDCPPPFGLYDDPQPLILRPRIGTVGVLR